MIMICLTPGPLKMVSSIWAHTRPDLPAPSKDQAPGGMVSSIWAHTRPEDPPAPVLTNNLHYPALPTKSKVPPPPQGPTPAPVPRGPTHAPAPTQAPPPTAPLHPAPAPPPPAPAPTAPQQPGPAPPPPAKQGSKIAPIREQKKILIYGDSILTKVNAAKIEKALNLPVLRPGLGKKSRNLPKTSLMCYGSGAQMYQEAWMPESTHKVVSSRISNHQEALLTNSILVFQASVTDVTNCSEAVLYEDEEMCKALMKDSNKATLEGHTSAKAPTNRCPLPTK